MPSNKKTVLCPIERDGKTFWQRLGVAFVNRDESLNVYLDGLPVNGKLQLRDWDEPRRDAAGNAAPLDATTGPSKSDEALPF